MQLRDYQQDVIRTIYQHFRDGKRRCLTFAPTGAGKSVLIAKIVADALLKKRRVLILVHRKKLASQLAETIEKLCNHKPSVIAPGYQADYNNPIQIAMAQTLSRRELPPDINILIADEAHVTTYFAIWHKCLDTYCGKIWALSKAFAIAFTATPWRMSSKEGFCHLFDCVASAPSPRELIKMGFLTNPRLFAYSVLDTSKLDTAVDGDYTVASLSRVCNEEYNRDVALKLSELCPERKTIVFCVTIAQAKSLNLIFIEEGVASEVVTGSTPEAEREKIFQRFKEGITRRLINVGTLCEGYDEASIEAVAIARPTRSPALLTQMVGRGLRISEGKEDVFIIDFGNCFDWLASTKVKGEKVVDPIDLSHVPLCPTYRPQPKTDAKACLNCGESIPTFARICPYCEARIPLKQKTVPNLIEFPDLEEIFTPIARKQYQFIRTEIKKCFEKGENPQKIYNKFHRKFGILPPKDYFLGAIFKLQSNEVNESMYYFFLSQFGMNSALKDMFADLEFGVIGRNYKLPNNANYIRESKKYEEEAVSITFHASSYLGVGIEATEREVRDAYFKKMSRHPDPIALNYAYDYCVKKR